MKFTSTLPWLILGLAAGPLGATTTFSFIDDTWTHGATTQTGYLDEATSGTLTKGGVTMSFQASLAGSGTAASRNLTLDGGNPSGFVFGTQTDANDLGGTLLNYQRWDFSFSQPVLINSLILDDIDSDNPDPLPSSGGFRDAIAGEGFSSQLPGTLGTGVDMSFTTNSPTDLIAGVIAAGNGQSLNYVISGPDDNQNNDAPNRAYLSFGTTPVSSFSIYSFSDRPRAHRVTLFQGIVEVTAVPEPSTMALGLLGGLCLLRRRR
jgi:hypothetical protein